MIVIRVQIGSAFAIAEESSAHSKFKEHIVTSREGDTMLSLKKLVPVRLLKNEFADTVAQAEAKGSSREELIKLLGRSRAKLGMFEGDLVERELEIGQVSAMLKDIRPAAQILNKIWEEFLVEKDCLGKLSW